MPAWAGVEMLMKGISNAVEGQEVIAKWPLGIPVTDLISSAGKDGISL
jgi:hypothetical protein